MLKGLMVYGDGTEVADLPAGTASYDGRVFMFGYPSDDPRGGEYEVDARGSLTLMADFASGDVTGSIQDLEARLGNEPYESDPAVIAISNGAISGNEFTADLGYSDQEATFDGDMAGQFFGPAAAEVGGVLSGTLVEPEETIVYHGFFGGEKQ